MEDIFETLKHAALLQKAGSGIGFPLHLLRPAGSRTVASAGTASGPVSFLHVYNSGTTPAEFYSVFWRTRLLVCASIWRD